MKGTMSDFIVLTVWMSVFVTVLLLLYNINTTLDGTILNTGGHTTKITAVLGNYDTILTFIFAGVVVVLLALAYFAGSTPIWTFISVLILMFAVFFAPQIANIPLDLAASFPTEAAEFPIVIALLQNIPLIITGLGILGLILMHSGGGYARV